MLHSFHSSREVANIAPPYGENRSRYVRGVPRDEKWSRDARKVAAMKLTTDSPLVTSGPVPPSFGALATEELSVELESNAFPSKATQPHPSYSPNFLS